MSMKPQKNAKTDGEKIVRRNEKGQLLPGEVLNPKGKAAGTLDFKTQWFSFVEKVAKQNNLLPEDIDNEIFAMVLREMRAGNFQFYKDTKDRIHGKATENVKLAGKVDLFSEVLREINEKHDPIVKR